MTSKRRRKQCHKCPWRTDVDPNDIPNGYCELKHMAATSDRVSIMEVCRVRRLAREPARARYDSVRAPTRARRRVQERNDYVLIELRLYSAERGFAGAIGKLEPRQAEKLMGLLSLATISDAHRGRRHLRARALGASNRTLVLAGVDVDPLMVDACAVNMALFVPWCALGGHPDVSALIGRAGIAAGIEGARSILEQADAARIAQGHEPLPSKDDGGEKPYAYDQHGQGELFSVTATGGGPKRA